ncbi:Bifunctional NAD(P)H-hydrate repair enzyme Nnr [Chlamydiales bacterium SCGC AG-110-M15]|nr:Bifunctional NAD(P)H-hydrate repair enzyme Nnr [Chlamydiales bacterium SCGC AG-110-M15]
MKVISAKEMALIEAEAFKEGASDEKFMDNAGAGIAEIISKDIEENHYDRHITLLCGKGNNGGDAYVAGKILMDRGYHVEALRLAALATSSPLCKKNHDIFVNGGGRVTVIENEGDLPIPRSGVFIDGIFGTGFRGEIYGTYASTIAMANKTRLPIYSIDIPSGVNGSTGKVSDITIKAKHTIFLGLPKTGMFLNNAWAYVGKLHGVDFGLDHKYVDSTNADFILINKNSALKLLPEINRTRHKYEAGYVVGLAGSPGMPGAALLSSLATLRSGAGIMRLIHPDGMQAELAHSPYEIIKQAYKTNENDLVLATLNCANATFIGPGIGRSNQTIDLLSEILPQIEKPCVLDADALNILAEFNIQLPRNVIMTPHIGEMHRLLRLKEKSKLSQDFIMQCADFATQNKVTLLLKGSPSFLFQEGHPIAVNPYGDPGMATAGTGDVLTGIVTGLLAQGLLIYDAAYLASYLHAKTGEHAAKQQTSYSILASDLINSLASVLKEK